MQVRISTVKRNGRTYRYAQLVESFRPPDGGTPTHRVLAHLGALSSQEVENFRTALAANRESKRVVIARSAKRGSGAPVPQVVSNLRYLDLAVLLELWKEWGLPQMLGDAMPTGEAFAPPAAIVAALVLQRCVAPGSKLWATQWFPTSALPELLGVSPASFNNTRVHRVLEELDSATAALQAELPRRYETHEGAFASLFLDVTDTWFVGDGPESAQRGKTKEDFVRRKIGIVLLCNEHGLPIRWEVVPGNTHDSKAMTPMLESVAQLSWARETPIVVDRAMGKTEQILEMTATGLRFLTAITVSEFDDYAPDLMNVVEAKDVEAAVRVVTQAGMEKVTENLFVKDLGTSTVSSTRSTSRALPADKSLRRVMQLVRDMVAWVKGGEVTSLASAGRRLGFSKSLTSKYYGLATLSEELQRAILEGAADGRSLVELLAIARLSLGEQAEAFQALLASRPHSLRKLPAPPAAERKEVSPSATVRVLAYFNPQRLFEQRARAEAHLAEINASVDRLNAELSRPGSRRTRNQVAAELDRILRKHDLLTAFLVNITERAADSNRPQLAVQVSLKAREWERRRRYDGFTVLVGAPSLTGTAADLCRLYRAKDAVEKDFQTIKSLVELRPVHHRTDVKVRAHVTLCMLALLLERTLTRRLAGTHSGPAALEMLAPCHLNRLQAASETVHALTELTEDQRSILRSLKLERVATADALERLAER